MAGPRPSLSRLRRATFAHTALALAMVVFSLAAISCPSGGGSSGPGGLLLSGRAVKGPLGGALVVAWSLNENGARGASVGRARTDAAGGFLLPLSGAGGPLLLEATGGTYTDEATGQVVAAPEDTLVLSAIIPSPAAVGARLVALTPLTTMAASRALALVGVGTNAATSALRANAEIAGYFGLADALFTTPADLTKPGASGASLEAIEYGAIIAGISQQAATLAVGGSAGVNGADLTAALATDVSDGVFDGKNAGVAVDIVPGVTLPGTAATTGLAAAMKAFLNSAANASGVSPGAVPAINRIRFSTGALPGPPAAPTLATPVAGSGKVTLFFAPVAGAASYTLYYAAEAGVTPEGFAALEGGAKRAGAVSGITIAGLSNGTAYSFVLTALNDVGEGAASAEVGATPMESADNTAPTSAASPTGGTFTAAQQVTLSAGESATIYYTTDGTAPSTLSPAYTAPFSLPPSAASELWTRAATAVPWGARSGHALVPFKGWLWVLGGGLPEIWSSADGVSWTKRATESFGARFGVAALEFQNSLWVLGGEGGKPENDAWSSPDGLNWTRATTAAQWLPREHAGAAALIGRMFLSGGRNDDADPDLGEIPVFADVWSSSDGVDWTLETDAPGWEARSEHGFVAFNDRLWVLGGRGENGFLGDVWSSPDGKTWTRESAPPWSARAEPVVVSGGKLWMVSGAGSASPAELWSSTDGRAWTRELNSAPWGTRAAAGVSVFQNNIWMAGGRDGLSVALGDAWRLTPPGSTRTITLRFFAIDAAGNVETPRVETYAFQ